MNETNGYDERRRGERSLSAITIGVAAVSVLGVGAVAAYDAQLFTSHSLNAGTVSGTSDSSRGDDGSRGDDDSGQLQPSTVAPATTQQAPAATSGGS